MSIQVNDFRWEPGKNDAEYIKLLESSRDDWQKIAQKAIAKLKALSKAQEPPTDVSISSAIECLLHPQDADDSDMLKAIDTAVRAMRAVKAQEPKLIKNSAGNGICTGCGRIIPAWSSPNHCGYCGQAVKWE